MANNSIKNETNVAWYDWHQNKKPRRLQCNGTSIPVTTGKVVAQSRQGDEVVIVEWDAENFPVSIENVDDLIELR